MTDLICIVCPKGCRLHVDEASNYAVTGNGCARGIEYGQNEVKNPVRVITSTVQVEGAALRRCPVKLDAPIPKGMILQAMRVLDDIVLTAPVKQGQIVAAKVCGTGANFVTTRDLDADGPQR